MSKRKLPRRAELLAFLLAFLAGGAAVWLVSYSAMTAMFGPGGTATTGVSLLYATPLAGLAVFQLVFGITGRWRGWRFWLFALPVVYAILLAMGALMWRGLLTPVAFAIASIGLIFLAGLWALGEAESHD